MGKASLNLIKITELSALETARQEGLVGWRGGKGLIESRTFSSRTSRKGGGGRCGCVAWRGVGKASLNLIKITELSVLGAVRQEGLDGGSVWARGVAKGLIDSH